MCATKSKPKADIRVVVDTNIFVPAIAGEEREAQFYNAAIRTCWKLVVSDQIIEEYGRVIHQFGYRTDAVFLELSKLDSMNKYRCSGVNPDEVGPDLAPRKDRHIVAPCLGRDANVIVTHDGGILERKRIILETTGAQVFNLDEALRNLALP